MTGATYEKSLCNDQTNQEWGGEAVLQAEDQRRYNMHLNMNNAKETPVQRPVDPAMQQANKKKTTGS